jgi:hypothetical protein
MLFIMALLFVVITTIIYNTVGFKTLLYHCLHAGTAVTLFSLIFIIPIGICYLFIGLVHIFLGGMKNE